MFNVHRSSCKVQGTKCRRDAFSPTHCLDIRLQQPSTVYYRQMTELAVSLAVSSVHVRRDFGYEMSD